MGGWWNLRKLEESGWQFTLPQNSYKPNMNLLEDKIRCKGEPYRFSGYNKIHCSIQSHQILKHICLSFCSSVIIAALLKGFIAFASDLVYYNSSLLR